MDDNIGEGSLFQRLIYFLFFTVLIYYLSEGFKAHLLSFGDNIG